MTMPKSVSHPLSLIFGLSAFLSFLFFQKNRWDLSNEDRALILILITSGVLAFIDLFIFKVHKNESTGLQWQKFQPSIKRSFIKWLGLLSTFACIAFAYWIFPEYNGEFYQSYFKTIQQYLSAISVLSFMYIYFIDGWMKNPEDSYYQLGRLTLLNFENADKSSLRPHFLGWTVKAFFMPLMFTYLVKDISKFNLAVDTWDSGFLKIYDYFYDLSFLIDVGFVSMGYLFSLRLVDSHIRSTEPTFKGWLVAIICYEPFWSLVGGQYLRYGSSQNWTHWLKDSPSMLIIWGGLILFCQMLYVWSSIQFGLRFSNLTHRGIITNGPYRFTKHPAYIAKNFSYWLISFPLFTSDSLSEALKRISLLLLLNYVYYLRAKTEEAHLSMDPQYVAYQEWIRAKGLFKF